MQQHRSRLVLSTFIALTVVAGTARAQQYDTTGTTRDTTAMHHDTSTMHHDTSGMHMDMEMGGMQQADTLTATLSGAEAVPQPGDSTGTGTSTVVLGEGQVCYTLNVTGLASPPTAAHIHKGDAGKAGPIVVPFKTPENGSATGCIQSTPEVISGIRQNPGGYYVNVHTAQHPDGAIRGQLSK
jgi:hypothetical protein